AIGADGARAANNMSRAATRAALLRIRRRATGPLVSMLRGQVGREPVGAELGRHAALAAMAPSHLDDLARTELGEPEPSQRLHVDEDIRSTVSSRQEAKAPNAVEPLDHGPLPIALGLDHDVGALWQLRGMDCGALIHAQNPKCLQA